MAVSPQAHRARGPLKLNRPHYCSLFQGCTCSLPLSLWQQSFAVPSLGRTGTEKHSLSFPAPADATAIGKIYSGVVAPTATQGRSVPSFSRMLRKTCAQVVNWKQRDTHAVQKHSDKQPGYSLESLLDSTSSLPQLVTRFYEHKRLL